jgi:mannose-6-phosphate isomerase-like protein (cupin superfamily)
MSYPEPRYHGDKGEVSAVYRAASEPPDLTIGTTVEARYLAMGATTDGQFGLYRWDMGPRAGGPGPHFHKTITESFFVLSGTVLLHNGERETEATAGDFLYVPQGGLHGFANRSDEPASILLLFTPGAPREPYFQALADVAAGRQMRPEEWTDLFLAHDTFYV